MFKQSMLLSAVVMVLGASLVGCQNTAEGVRQDSQQVGETAARTAENAADATQDAAKDASAALVVTPKIKNAITADPQLNDTRNLIDVDSKDNVVHLKGHVISNEMKRRAGEIAQRALNESKSTDKLSNELVVQGNR